MSQLAIAALSQAILKWILYSGSCRRLKPARKDKCRCGGAGLKACPELAEEGRLYPSDAKKKGGIQSGGAAPSCTSDAVRPRIPPTQELRALQRRSEPAYRFASPSLALRSLCDPNAGILALWRFGANSTYEGGEYNFSRRSSTWHLALGT